MSRTAVESTRSRRWWQFSLHSERRRWLLVIGLLAAIPRVPLLFASSSLGGDAIGYQALALHLLHGTPVDTTGDWAGSFAGSYGPLSLFRPPGYPLFVALCNLLGSPVHTAQVINHLLGIALVVAVAAVTWDYFGKLAGILSGVVAGLSPLMLASERLVVPDPMFGIPVFTGAVLIIVALNRHPIDYRFLAVAGVTFGLATYIKPSGELLLLAAPVPLVIATRSLRQTIYGSVVVAVGLGLTVAPWCARNWIVYGTPAFSTAGNITLFRAVFCRNGHAAASDLQIPESSTQDRLVARLVADSARVRGATCEYYVLKRLPAYGIGSPRRENLELSLAVSAIEDQPVPYVRTVMGNLRTFVSQTTRESFFPNGIPGEANYTAVINPEVTLYAVWRVLTAVGLFALALLFAPRRQRVAAVCLLSVWAVIALGTSASTVLTDPRYAASVLPEFWITATAGTVFVAQTAWSVLTERFTGTGVSL
jgi:4-amino-4-deoxy-L-arabinose transferase-like glycosyltransferase